MNVKKKLLVDQMDQMDQCGIFMPIFIHLPSIVILKSPNEQYSTSVHIDVLPRICSPKYYAKSLPCENLLLIM